VVGLGEAEGGTEQSMGVQSAFRMHLPLGSGIEETSLSSRQPNHHTRVPQMPQKTVQCHSLFQESKNAEITHTEDRLVCSGTCHLCSCVSSANNMQVGLYVIHCLLAIHIYFCIALTCVTALLLSLISNDIYEKK